MRNYYIMEIVFYSAKKNTVCLTFSLRQTIFENTYYSSVIVVLY